MLNTVSIGDIGESIAVAKFTQKGYIVSKPISNNARYDLILEIDNKLYKVQVKTTNSIKDGKMNFSMKTTNYTQGNWKSVAYDAKDVDLFFLYCIENDWCGLFIVTDEHIQQSISIRIAPPNNNQRKNIQLMEDFEFDTQFAKFIEQVEEN